MHLQWTKNIPQFCLQLATGYLCKRTAFEKLITFRRFNFTANVLTLLQFNLSSTLLEKHTTWTNNFIINGPHINVSENTLHLSNKPSQIQSPPVRPIFHFPGWGFGDGGGGFALNQLKSKDPNVANFSGGGVLGTNSNPMSPIFPIFHWREGGTLNQLKPWSPNSSENFHLGGWGPGGKWDTRNKPKP